MGIRNMIAKAGAKAADKVADLAALSPEQMRDMQAFREAYLSQSPDPNDKEGQELTMRLLASAGIEIYNAYLPQIKDLYLPLDADTDLDNAMDPDYTGDHFRPKPFNDQQNIRSFNITKWVTDTKENSLEKLVNVYATLSNEDCNIALIFRRTIEKTDVYLAVVNTQNSTSNTEANSFADRIAHALRGNFPGSEWDEKIHWGTLSFMKNDISYSVASASNVPTEKSEKFISQTIEKLLDGDVPTDPSNEYTLILLATPIRDVEERKLRLSELYTGLYPYSGWQTSYTYTESNAINSSATFGVNAGVSAGVQQGQNQSTGSTQGETDSTNQSISDTENESEADTETHTDSKGEADLEGETTTETDGITNTEGTNDGVNASVNVEVGGNLSPVKAGASAGYSHGWSQSVAESYSKAVAKNVAKTLTKTVADSVGKTITKGTAHTVANTVGKAISNTVSKTQGAYKGVNFGGNFGANFARSSNVTATVGENETINQSFTNFNIKHALEVLEEQMKRYEQSVALGMWDFAAYVISEDNQTVNNVAHSYIALTQGEKSYLSQASINVWRGDITKEKNAAGEICKYLKQLRHPIFVLKPEVIEEDMTFNAYPTVVTAATSLSGKELAYSLNFPQRSVVGLPVLQCAEFGRNVVSYSGTPEGATVKLGNVFHMNKEDENVPVCLSKDSLTSHTFITGSTGAGKSNTVYSILESVKKDNVKFLVVEPAKGEYKTVFGNDSDVNVYSTNPLVADLLKINAFSFPETIHVLEHLDRLVEIFNVCWPMYAAMPAVLKEAIVKSYKDCGWNLTSSINEFGNDLYPTFADVARNVKVIIDSSEYDAENKGAYKGSLLTRLQSLTNGINGMVFTSDEIPSEKLFDENVIVDLSRVGSSETKSLIMGMLVLKLQEYRMATAAAFNSELKHLTVLEEAHNLLRRTSTEQPAEGANLMGKSVEMISNAIAEMRTYGEGFIIADQAPGLLDMSVIRNTNTKIIMRLPDESDRMLVGKAANLNDDQIVELARLPLGVGAVYQNDWVQPVLCKVPRAKHESYAYEYERKPQSIENRRYDERLEIARMLSRGIELKREVVLTEIKAKLNAIGLSSSTKAAVMQMLMDPPKEPRMTKFGPIMSELYSSSLAPLDKTYRDSSDPAELTGTLEKEMHQIYGGAIDSQVERDIIQGIITYYLLEVKHDRNMMQEWIECSGGFGNVS